MPLLDDAARQRVEAAIRDVESRTAGEIVVVTVPRSEPYHDVRLVYGIAFALAGAGVVHALFPRLAFGWLLWIEAGLVGLMWLAFNIPEVLRLLVPTGRAEASVARRAELEFFEHRVYDTRDHTGVLILICELEHRVTILGDKGIYEQLQADAFKAYVQRVIDAIRAGRAGDGLAEVITDLGAKLAQHMPVKPDDRDELPNVVRQEDR